MFLFSKSIRIYMIHHHTCSIGFHQVSITQINSCMVILASKHQSSLTLISIHQQNVAWLHYRFVKYKFNFFFWDNPKFYEIYTYKSTLMSNGESKSFNIACFVSFSERLACSVGIFQSIPSDSSKIEIPPSASG